ncbi:SGNH/GDSL hydrolase family protein [Shinella sp. M31]|uniref:SGNH/GDSL hydrolase family protein n=1 Tax=Shinella sp. M31 TaxID=3368615 RepID=UPI003BA17E20
MADAGVRTTNFDPIQLADELLANRDGSTGAIPVASLAIQMAGTGAIADALDDLSVRVDAAAVNSRPVYSMQLATTGNVVLSGEQVIDGQLTAASDVVVKDQADQRQNGAWRTGAGAWARLAAFDTGAELHTQRFFVRSGTSNASITFGVQNPTIPVIGTDNIVIKEVERQNTSKPSALDALRGAANAIATAAAINLDTATGDLVPLTGSVTVSTVTLGTARERWAVVTDAPLFVVGPSLKGSNGDDNVQAGPGDRIFFKGETGGVVKFVLHPANPVFRQGSSLTSHDLTDDDDNLLAQFMERRAEFAGFVFLDDANPSIDLVDEDDNIIPADFETPATTPSNNVRLLPRLLVDGDSMGAQVSSPGRTAARGWMFWLQLATGARFDFQPGYNFAKAGDTSEDMLARISGILSAPAARVINIIQTNDRTPGSATAPVSPVWPATRTQAALKSYRNQLLSSGKEIAWIATVPRGDGLGRPYSAGLAGDNLAHQFAMRRWFLDDAALAGVEAIDVWPVLADPALTTGKALDTDLHDGLHGGPRWARKIGFRAAPYVMSWFPPRPRLVASNGDLYAAGNPRGALNANPMMLGSGGTLGAGCDGDLATGWSAVAGAGLTAHFEKRIIDGVEWQECVVSGAPTAFNPGTNPVDPVPVSVEISAPLTNLAVGDKYEGIGEIWMLDGAIGVRGFAIYTTTTTSSGTVTCAAGEPSLARAGTPNLDLSGEEFSGIAPVPVSEPLIEVPTAAKIAVVIAGAPHDPSYPDVPISGTFRFRAVSAHKTI